MTAVDYTFFASTAGIVGMVLLKVLELRTGRPSLMSKMSGLTNNFLRGEYLKWKRFFAYFNKRNGVLLLRFILIHTIIWFRKMYAFVKNFLMSLSLTKKLHNIINGKGALRRKGAVSFFLKRIAADAEEAHQEAIAEIAAQETVSN